MVNEPVPGRAKLESPEGFASAGSPDTTTPTMLGAPADPETKFVVMEYVVELPRRTVRSEGVTTKLKSYTFREKDPALPSWFGSPL